jgi:hypothetical protein
MSIGDTLLRLLNDLGTLAHELFALGWPYVLLMVWVAWWLWGVNWKRAWPILAQGAWAPLLLLMVVSALAWSRIAPSSCLLLGVIPIPNFWCQLGYVGMLVALMFFCGWLQGVVQWAPADINLDPPPAGHGDDHGHGHHH